MVTVRTKSRDDGKRRIVLSANAQQRPLSEVVEDIRAVVADLKLPEGYFITLGGQFQAQEEASRLVGLLSIVSLVLMFVVLYSRYKSVRLSALIMANIPLALVGAVIDCGSPVNRCRWRHSSASSRLQVFRCETASSA
ncbi:efflux RND transporter permease subunit [Thauera humireducens]|uniref:efflux RND transporter permease subunit n=1 Tax=Thauera humireducens TaxID=1134435 RepID=UPI00311F8E3E